jgi:hypothetical protein
MGLRALGECLSNIWLRELLRKRSSFSLFVPRNGLSSFALYMKHPTSNESKKQPKAKGGIATKHLQTISELPSES